MADDEKKKDFSFGLSIAVLGILGIFTLGLGAAMIISNLRGPFMFPIPTNSNFSADLNTNLSPEEQKLIDSDKDGLNDFEELYVYQTSPYLPDSDSDGYQDKEEIDSGHDPNCPIGQDCRASVSPPANSNNNINFNPLTPTGLTNQGLELEELDLDNLNEFLKNLNPAEIRELLLETGQITEEQLNQISDEDLMKMVEEILTEQQQ